MIGRTAAGIATMVTAVATAGIARLITTTMSSHGDQRMRPGPDTVGTAGVGTKVSRFGGATITRTTTAVRQSACGSGYSRVTFANAF